MNHIDSTASSDINNNNGNNNTACVQEDEVYKFVPLSERVSNYQKKLDAEQKKLDKPCKDKEKYVIIIFSI